MSSSRRDELVKILGKKAEEAKVAIRNVRKDFQNLIRDAKKDKVISENFFNRLNDVLQKVTDAFVEKAEQMRVKERKRNFIGISRSNRYNYSGRTAKR